MAPHDHAIVIVCICVMVVRWEVVSKYSSECSGRYITSTKNFLTLFPEDALFQQRMQVSTQKVMRYSE